MKIEISNLDEHKEEIQSAVRLAVDYLHLDPVSITVDKLELNKINGMCIDISEDEYLILLRPRDKMLETLFYEMAHVRQYMYENLGIELDKMKQTDYTTRWWEVESNKLAKKHEGIVLCTLCLMVMNCTYIPTNNILWKLWDNVPRQECIWRIMRLPSKRMEAGK